MSLAPLEREASSGRTPPSPTRTSARTRRWTVSPRRRPRRLSFRAARRSRRRCRRRPCRASRARSARSGRSRAARARAMAGAEGVRRRRRRRSELDVVGDRALERRARDELGGASFDTCGAAAVAAPATAAGPPFSAPQLPITPVVLGATRAPAPRRRRRRKRSRARVRRAHVALDVGLPQPAATAELAPPVRRESAGSPAARRRGSSPRRRRAPTPRIRPCRRRRRARTRARRTSRPRPRVALELALRGAARRRISRCADVPVATRSRTRLAAFSSDG